GDNAAQNGRESRAAVELATLRSRYPQIRAPPPGRVGILRAALLDGERLLEGSARDLHLPAAVDPRQPALGELCGRLERRAVRALLPEHARHDGHWCRCRVAVRDADGVRVRLPALPAQEPPLPGPARGADDPDPGDDAAQLPDRRRTGLVELVSGDHRPRRVGRVRHVPVPAALPDPAARDPGGRALGGCGASATAAADCAPALAADLRHRGADRAGQQMERFPLAADRHQPDRHARPAGRPGILVRPGGEQPVGYHYGGDHLRRAADPDRLRLGTASHHRRPDGRRDEGL
ncbi:MAG: ABC transporter, permease protein 2 (cluster 1, maltose/g3p/polyamine/iron), partial [uncultured Thermomicrobiales bacterium]